MLSFLIDAAATAVMSGAVSTIVSYQSGLLSVDLNPIKDYVDAKVDDILARKG